jgi:hypothetical protein
MPTVIAAELQPRARLSDASERVRERVAAVPSVSRSHVRRGDYVTSSHVAGFHGVLPLEYYKRALSHVRDRVEGLQVFVFFRRSGLVPQLDSAILGFL